MMPPASRCDALTGSGRPCRKRAIVGGRCRWHAGRPPPQQIGDPLIRLLSPEDQALLAALDEGEGLLLLQRIAELRALRAHRASLEDAGSNTLDQIFARNLHAAEVILRARLRLAEAEAEGTAPGVRNEPPDAPDEAGRKQRLTELLEALRGRSPKAETGQE
jgi:hypothetical protein